MLSLLPQLRGFARFLTGQAAAADDLVQETVLRALDALEQFTPGSSMKAWLYTIARNLFYEQARHRRRERDVISDYAQRPDRPESGTAEGEADALRDLDGAIWQLSPRLREALVLVGVQEMTYAEAAAVCGVTVGTIKARVSRARAQIADYMGPDGPGGA